MADCKHCGHHDPGVVAFMGNKCPRCNTQQLECPRCSEPSANGLVCENCIPVVAEVRNYANTFDDILSYMRYGKKGDEPLFEAIIAIMKLYREKYYD